jgi:DNA-binding NarL/FixJ family response regulator
MIAIIISTDPAIRAQIELALEATVDAESVMVSAQYPSAADMRALADTQERYIAFIDFGADFDRAIALASEIDLSCPSIGVVGLNVGSIQTRLIAIVRAGICEILPQPFLNRDIATAVHNVSRKLASISAAPPNSGAIYAFLPAKPGAGASSLAMYSALACGRLSGTHPLFLDFDIRLGCPPSF